MDSGGTYSLGPNSFDRYIHDPRRLGFMLSRYKFAAKMLNDCISIIDCGCGDGFGTVSLLDESRARTVYGVDFDQELIDHANQNLVPALRTARPGAIISFLCADIMRMQSAPNDGLCCLDVIEHVEPDQSVKFISKLDDLLLDGGIAVIGTPSANAAQYASKHSKVGHTNLYQPDRFRAELSEVFRHTFLFSMNDEMVHTGFDQLAHYLIAVCVK